MSGNKTDPQTFNGEQFAARKATAVGGTGWIVIERKVGRDMNHGWETTYTSVAVSTMIAGSGLSSTEAEVCTLRDEKNEERRWDLHASIELCHAVVFLFIVPARTPPMTLRFVQRGRCVLRGHSDTHTDTGALSANVTRLRGRGERDT